MRALTFITSTLIVSAAGVAFGMLYAPQKGSKTRRELSKKNDRYTEYLSEKFDHFLDKISHQLKNVEEQTQHLADKAISGEDAVEVR